MMHLIFDVFLSYTVSKSAPVIQLDQSGAGGFEFLLVFLILHFQLATYLLPRHMHLNLLSDYNKHQV